ncbi:2-amino-4-hydroxy-6-hydroxymethyldihydropteridine diphosphokinase [Ignatzschineria indica]|uniref:2-amino-4-hydroxy-6-hydroxymethyldihydropteridine pyrophosphokinase n=1 Tax=Ignatzschineria indica TaxID=472583 RepID=A0A2U2AI55_9GAMM|nr:2-amino-4-hydroxy-6-hydroxymethyldihydropteridine diphosphokinase [Ignatzschineria indica]PWD82269.1 2-amino-4-hydroxy-6-hydroxymethyldihydropteridine diphosphokinase [Ignatzschineria indica]GGZ87663.1 2-amino-4-hydroxy-6-hydroxymethyldihydropteridine diphosphokinase [Ignatzschineria indica]
MNIVYLSLGSNLNDPLLQVKTAIKEIPNSAEITLLAISSLYETPPIGPKQPNFINAVVKIGTSLSPLQLLEAMQEIEKKHQRERTIHWGPRTLDIDLLLYNDQKIDIERLTIPHPFMHERAFVLLPLLEIEPTLETPLHGTLSKYLETLADRFDIVKVEDPPLIPKVTPHA